MRFIGEITTTQDVATKGYVDTQQGRYTGTMTLTPSVGFKGESLTVTSAELKMNYTDDYTASDIYSNSACTTKVNLPYTVSSDTTLYGYVESNGQRVNVSADIKFYNKIYYGFTTQEFSTNIDVVSYSYDIPSETSRGKHYIATNESSSPYYFSIRVPEDVEHPTRLTMNGIGVEYNETIYKQGSTIIATFYTTRVQIAPGETVDIYIS